ncbi:MAG: flagellar biosynthetic protein FliR [Bacteriovoracia bacterium]
MSSLLQFDQNEIMTFFAVLVRFSVIIATLPFLGDKSVPAPAKILLSVAITLVVYPILVSSGQVRPAEAAIWAAQASTLGGVIAKEALFGAVVGFSARMVFDAIQIGSDIAGSFMGFASASVFDPHQETQTQVVAKIQTTIAMLIFLAMDGHHLMLRSALDSYRLVGMGKAEFGAIFADKLIHFSGEVLRMGLQIAAPMAVALFGINIFYGVMARAVPQLNVLVLSFSISAFVGLFVMLLSVPEFQDVTSTMFGNIGTHMTAVMASMGR